MWKCRPVVLADETHHMDLLDLRPSRKASHQPFSHHLVQHYEVDVSEACMPPPGVLSCTCRQAD
jgi:hypothetical protein